jgi:hypothetical protein
MTQAQLEHAAADRTGESPRTIHRLGFGLQPDVSNPESEDLRLVVDCPFCGRPVEYPGRADKGTPALAECSNPRCDVYFDFAIGDVYVLRS